MNSVDRQEIQNFSKDSARWWDEKGPFAPLHRLNPVRLGYLRARIDAHFGLDPRSLKPFKGLSILDVGCGGGLVCEPMARLGGAVTGIDADESGIEAAKAHAAQTGLTIAYQATTTDKLPPARFDVVLALEIVEHVADMPAFVAECLALCKPGGLAVFSTLNRTPKSFALGIVAAEYILRWVPAGTHTWKKFVKPSELSRALRDCGGAVQDITGLIFDPLAGTFRLSATDIDVNYFVTAAKPAAL